MAEYDNYEQAWLGAGLILWRPEVYPFGFRPLVALGTRLTEKVTPAKKGLAAGFADLHLVEERGNEWCHHPYNGSAYHDVRLTACRELEEETGIRVNPSRVRNKNLVWNGVVWAKIANEERHFFHTSLYALKLKRREAHNLLTAHNEEITGWRFYTEDEVTLLAAKDMIAYWHELMALQVFFEGFRKGLFRR